VVRHIVTKGRQRCQPWPGRCQPVTDQTG